MSEIRPTPINAISARGVSIGERLSFAPLCQVLAGVVLLSLAAQVRFVVPGTEVPATLQSFGVLVLALVLPAHRAVAATVVYVLLGTAGWPVFAAHSAGLSGSTGGFLIGFPVAALVIGILKGTRPESVARLSSAGLAGMAVLFALGNLWRFFYFSLAAAEPIGISTVLATGVWPFGAKALVEVALAATLVTKLQRSRRLRGWFD